MGADPQAVYDLLNKGGLLAFMVIVGILLTVGSFRKWYVPGWLYEEAKEGAKEWEALAKAQQERLDRVITMQESLQRRQEEIERAVAVGVASAARVEAVMLRFETTLNRVEGAIVRVDGMMGRAETALVRLEAQLANRPNPRGTR